MSLLAAKQELNIQYDIKTEVNVIKPDFEEFKKMTEKGNIIPIVKVIQADIETPVSAYLKIRDRSTYSFLLESVEGGEKIARFSFCGADPFLVFRSRGNKGTVKYLDTGREKRFEGDPINELRKIMGSYKTIQFPGLPRFTGGGVGYFAYDSVRLIEDIPDNTRDDFGFDDIFFMFFDTILVFDNVRHTISIISNIHTDSEETPENKYEKALSRIEKLETYLKRNTVTNSQKGNGSFKFTANVEKDVYENSVEKCKEYINAGDIIQVVLSQRFEREISVSPFDIYRMLRMVNPSPYMFFISTDNVDLAGASPEMLVRVENGEMEVRPIAGTRPRGKNSEEDDANVKELLNDEKEKAEHIMLLDLGRNDVGRVSEYGTVKVTDRMFIEKYSHVMHMVSSVKGKLRKDKDRFDAFLSFFPAGTLSGAPKIRAMEIIDELETTRRGIYGGAIGYIDYQGNLDSCIAIRTVVIKDGKAYVQAGAGIVADSVPEKEYTECVNKAGALFKAMEMAENGTLTL